MAAQIWKAIFKHFLDIGSIANGRWSIFDYFWQFLASLQALLNISDELLITNFFIVYVFILIWLNAVMLFCILLKQFIQLISNKTIPHIKSTLSTPS